MELLQLAGALVVVAGLIAFVVHFYLRNPDRDTAMRNAARKMGLRYRHAGDLAFRDRLPKLSIFRDDWDGEILSVLEGTWQGHELVVFDYRITPRQRAEVNLQSGWPRRVVTIELEDLPGIASIYTTVVALKTEDSLGSGRHPFGAWTVEYRGRWAAAYTRTDDSLGEQNSFKRGSNKAPWVDPDDLPGYVDEAIALMHAPDGSTLLDRADRARTVR